jgi:hypothetical protein
MRRVAWKNGVMMDELIYSAIRERLGETAAREGEDVRHKYMLNSLFN